MTGWQDVPMQVRQCILLFSDGYTAARLAFTCRELRATLLADRWLWAALYEVTFPQTEEERHWREWSLAGLSGTNGYSGNLWPSRLGSSDGQRCDVDWYLVFQRRAALQYRWQHGQYVLRRINLPRPPKAGRMEVAAASPWRTILVLGDEWDLWVVEHGVCAAAPYRLTWSSGCWPGPREFLQNADYIVAVNNFAGHQHSTWVWRAGCSEPITKRWPILQDARCCPTELYGRWLLVTGPTPLRRTDSRNFGDSDVTVGDKEDEPNVNDAEGEELGVPELTALDGYSRSASRTPEPTMVRAFHLIDLVDGGVVSVDVPGGFTTCHIQAAGAVGVRIYCARCDVDVLGQSRLSWELWGWRGPRTTGLDSVVCTPAAVLHRGSCMMHADLFNGRFTSLRLDASRVLLEARPVWTNECLYIAHSLQGSEVLHQGAVGAGRAFPLGRQQLRYLPCNSALSVLLNVQPDGDVQVSDVVVDLPVRPGRQRSRERLRGPPVAQPAGVNVQLRRIAGHMFYATPVCRPTPRMRHHSLFMPSSMGRVAGLATGCATASDTDSVIDDRPLTFLHGLKPLPPDAHCLVDAKRGRLSAILQIPGDVDPRVAVCATHICLVEARSRTMLLLDFGNEFARDRSAGNSASSSLLSRSNHPSGLTDEHKLSGSFEHHVTQSFSLRSRTNTSSGLASLADALKQLDSSQSPPQGRIDRQHSSRQITPHLWYSELRI